MGTNYLAILGVTTMTTVMSCSSAKKEYASYELYPVRSGNLVEMEYAPGATRFTLWAPTADEVRLMLYDAGEGGHAYETEKMEPAEDGTWTVTVDKDLLGKFYTFNVKIDDKWQGDTPGINARAVGVNGKRAAIIDWKSTQPEGWESDRRPTLKSAADMIIYEMHHRDFSSDSTSGVKNKGKYLALTERGTMNADKRLTGIDHLRELGITHVHLLPSYDYASVDETKLEEKQYNWGYDPLNYNVPDGSYSTDPYQPAVRVKEFKQMVQALHQAGIRVIMDVVYNHTFNTIESNFERTAPGYFYRRKEDGSLANGSGCGNETASERPSGAAAKMAEQEGVDIRKYSVIYDAIEEVKSAMEGMLAPEVKEQVTATIEIREVFNITKVGLVAGAMVKTGKVKRSDKARLIRDGIVIFTGNINALKRFKDDVKEVGTNFECGISLVNCNDMKVGDMIEAFEEIEVKQTL